MAGLILFLAGFAQAAVAQDEKIRRIDSVQDWSVFINKDGAPSCWVATKPLRSPGFIIHNLVIYVTHEREFSVQDRAKGITRRSTAVLNASGNQFPMTVSENSVFINDPSRNAAIVQSLASDWRPRVVFDRGRHVAFSTQGFAKAFSKAVEACED
ncbi:hypothetical protein [Allosediminivita pacifica]|nr:hypothetical protein [Allosediminivita pacifica]